VSLLDTAPETKYRPGHQHTTRAAARKRGVRLPNLVQISERYALFVTVIAGQAGGPLITIDSHGHIHIQPTSPDSRRIVEELTPHVAELTKVMNQIAGIAEKAKTEA
jgi:hypothetical protein